MRNFKVFLILIIFMSVFLFALPCYATPFLDQTIPQPVYRVPMGQEIEFLAKLVQQLNYLYTLIQKTEKVYERDLDNSSLLNVLMGSDDLVDVVARENLHKMSKKDWEKWVASDVGSIFGGTEELYREISDQLRDIDKKRIETEVAVKMSENTDPLIIEMKEDSGEKDREIIEDRNKAFKEKEKLLNDKYNYIKAYYKDIETKYGDEEQTIPGSVSNYITKEKEYLVNAENNFDNISDKMTLSLALKSLNKLMIQNNRMNLKILESLQDINNQLAIIGSIITKKNIGEEYIDIKRRFHR